MKRNAPSSTSVEPARCQHTSLNGRCRMPALDSDTTFCHDHAHLASDTVDLLAPLTQNAFRFQNAQGINYSLTALHNLLAQGRISPRRASVLAYIDSLLLRTLTAIDNDLYPQAGRPILSLPAIPQTAASQARVDSPEPQDAKSDSEAAPSAQIELDAKPIATTDADQPTPEDLAETPVKSSKPN
jgi:hypothetical protein